MTAPEAARTSIWDDFLDIYIAPSRLFARRTDGKFAHGILVWVVLAAVLFFGTKAAMDPILRAEFERGMASRPGMTPEQMEAARKFASIGASIFIVVGAPIMMLLLGAVVWVVSRVIGRSLTYAQGAVIAVFSMYPRLVDSIVSALQALVMDESKLNSRYVVSLGFGRFMDASTANPLMLALLGRVDVFTIWITILIAIGLKVMAKASWAQAATGAALIWLIGALPGVIGALRAA